MLNTKVVLIADDDAPTRMLLRAGISQWGYKIVEASDGEQAWNLLQQPDAPRLLILDWLMPKMNGITVCEKIRKELSDKPYIYVILLTQLTGAENVNQGLEAGADEFISKPFNMAELHSRLLIGDRILQYEANAYKCASSLQTFSDKLTKLSDQVSQGKKDSASEIITELKKDMSSLLEDFKRK